VNTGQKEVANQAAHLRGWAGYAGMRPNNAFFYQGADGQHPQGLHVF
jgi:hypothetical protein